MNKSSFFLPQGVKDFLPERAEKLAEIEETLFSVFRSFGFRRITTPSFEFLDVISVGAGEDLKEAAFKFNDRVSGQVIAISPDVTPQVARVVASRLRDFPLPLRLFYGGRVLRERPGALGRSREIFQAGVELIGLTLPEADAEMIAMGIECLRRLGLDDFKIDVGQVEFVRGILREAHLSGEVEKEVRQTLGKKDVSTLESLLREAGVNGRAQEIILSLPGLNGGKEVLDKAEGTAINQGARQALENLRQVIAMVEVYGLADFVTIDLGEIRGFDYYTGVIFEGFVSGQGSAVLGGGRYDTLLKKYGYDCPATGFALNLEALLLALEARGRHEPRERIDFLLIDLRREKREALEMARSLRQQGFKVARDIIKRDVAGSLEYARRNGIGRAIIMGQEGCPQDQVVLKVVETGEETRLEIARLLAGQIIRE